jgi:hypothetical protein
MPKQLISFEITLRISTSVDPDDLSDFTGDSADPADLITYLEGGPLTDGDEFVAFGADTNPDVDILGYTNLKVELCEAEESDA